MARCNFHFQVRNMRMAGVELVALSDAQQRKVFLEVSAMIHGKRRKTRASNLRLFYWCCSAALIFFEIPCVFFGLRWCGALRLDRLLVTAHRYGVEMRCCCDSPLFGHRCASEAKVEVRKVRRWGAVGKEGGWIGST